MTHGAEDVVIAVFSFILAAIVILFYLLAKTREDVVRLKQRLDDLLDRLTRRRVRGRDEEAD